jgi:hypothetical protein
MPQHPPTRAAPLPAQAGDGTHGVIPYKNMPALLAYYAGVFSVIPFFPIGLTALFLGIAGLRARTRNPAIKGSIHAWIGIVIGGFVGLLWLGVTIMILIAAAQRR